MNDSTNIKPQTFLISFQGNLDDSWQSWFSGLRISMGQDAQGKTVTTMSGEIVDQAALRGVLNKLWDLNLNLVSVNLVKPAIDWEGNHEN